MEPGSFHLTKKRDYYLYTTTHRVKREKQENSSGGGGSGGTTVDSDGFSGSGRNLIIEPSLHIAKKAGPVWIYLHLQVPAFL